MFGVLQGTHLAENRLDDCLSAGIDFLTTANLVWKSPRKQGEPQLLFFDEIRNGVQHGALWTYMWAPILLGGDARYLSGEPLIIALGWIAFFVGLFEAYAMVQFIRMVSDSITFSSHSSWAG